MDFHILKKSWLDGPTGGEGFICYVSFHSTFRLPAEGFPYSQSGGLTDPLVVGFYLLFLLFGDFASVDDFALVVEFASEGDFASVEDFAFVAGFALGEDLLP